MCWWKITRVRDACLGVSDSRRPRAFGTSRRQSSQAPPFLRLRKRHPFSFERSQAESSGKWFPPLQDILLSHALFTNHTQEDTYGRHFFRVALKCQLSASRGSLRPRYRGHFPCEIAPPCFLSTCVCSFYLSSEPNFPPWV